MELRHIRDKEKYEKGNPFGVKVLAMSPVQSVTYLSGMDPEILERETGLEPATLSLEG